MSVFRTNEEAAARVLALWGDTCPPVVRGALLGGSERAEAVTQAAWYEEAYRGFPRPGVACSLVCGGVNDIVDNLDQALTAWDRYLELGLVRKACAAYAARALLEKRSAEAVQMLALGEKLLRDEM